MKKLLALVALLGLGVMFGCGEEPKKPTTAKPVPTAASKADAPKADAPKADTPAAPAPKDDKAK